MEQNKTDYRKGMIADMKEPKLRFKASNGREFPEWEEKKIGSLLKVTSVKRVHASDWTNEGVPFYRAREIISLYAGQSISPLYISEVCYAKFSAISGTIHTDDLLVTGVGTIGVPYLVKNGDRFYFKDGNIIWIQNRGSVVGLYLYYCFDTDFVKQQQYIGFGKIMNKSRIQIMLDLCIIAGIFCMEKKIITLTIMD